MITARIKVSLIKGTHMCLPWLIIVQIEEVVEKGFKALVHHKDEHIKVQYYLFVNEDTLGMPL